MIWRLLSRAASRGGRHGGLTVLFFHRVLPTYDPLLPDEPTPAAFEQLLRWLRTQFTLLPLGEALKRLNEDRVPAGAAAITFDDGYRDNLEVAAPLLLRHGVPATFFVTTAYADGGLMWNDRLIEAIRATSADRLDLEAVGLGRLSLRSDAERRAAVVRLIDRLKYVPGTGRDRAVADVTRACQPSSEPRLMMNADELRHLLSLGFAIGAHTASHPILMQIDDAQAEREIREGRAALQATLDHDVPLFAYPNGRRGLDFDDRHVDMVRRAGFSAAFTTDPGVCHRGSALAMLPRFTPWDRREVRFRLQLLRNQFRRQPGAAATREPVRPPHPASP
jgi:peptidoglycan/xylan/chitin deacetylase (PgdA/CDA1 family)